MPVNRLSSSKKFISIRKAVQLASAIILVIAMGWFHLSLWWILLIGILTVPIAGKFFCRWICPMGMIMEWMTKGLSADDKARHNYMYYKLGCPIAWVGGWLNRWSLLGIRLDKAKCTDCNVCDSACYISTFKDNTSLHKSLSGYSPDQYQCSRCGDCITSCPTNALSIGIGKNISNKQKEY